MRFGLPLSISGVVLLGFSWAAKLRGGRRERMCVFVYKSVCVSERGVIGHTMLAHPYRVTY